METALAITMIGGVALCFVSLGLLFAEEEVLAETIGLVGIALFLSIPVIFLLWPVFLLYLIARLIKSAYQYLKH